MFADDTYMEDREVFCAECSFDGEVSIPLVAYGTVEVGEWDCPQCSSYHEYREDMAWDMADNYRSMTKEGF
jgi:acetone carboxylase gamma subunit